MKWFEKQIVCPNVQNSIIMCQIDLDELSNTKEMLQNVKLCMKLTILTCQDDIVGESALKTFDFDELPCIFRNQKILKC